MNITQRQVQPKVPRPDKDPAYLAAVAALPCVVCETNGGAQQSRTTVHHTNCGRYGNRKTPDRQAIPLCDGHHQGNFDTSKIAIHRQTKLWRASYGQDTDYIARTQDAVAGQLTEYEK